MLQFNNNHIFSGYLKQFLASFNLPTCRVYTAEFEKFYAEHGYEDPRVIESNLPIVISAAGDTKRPGVGITYLKNGCAQQYFWDTHNWKAHLDINRNTISKYWKSNQALHYNGNKVLGLTKTLKNPTTLYNYQTHEYLGDYLRFLRDYENINLMSMYNCFSDRLCNNIKVNIELNDVQTINVNAYDTSYKIYMLPVKLFENYTIAIDCYQGVEMFCGFYNEKLDTSDRALDLIKRTYQKVPKALFNQPFIYNKLGHELQYDSMQNKYNKHYYWTWEEENKRRPFQVNSDAPVGSLAGAFNVRSIMCDTTKIVRSEIAMRESELKLFIKVPATNTSSIVVLEGDYRSFNDSLYTVSDANGWQYVSNSTAANFETKKTYRHSNLPDLNAREFKPISKLQLLALNTGISYPFADRLMEYLVMNVIVPNDATPDNIKRLQKVMKDCGYSFQIDGIWEPKMQMILYDYLMNGGKFTVEFEKDSEGNLVHDSTGNKKPTGKVTNMRTGNLKQAGQKMCSDFYDILGYGDKDAEKLYASWTVVTNEKTGRSQATAKTTLENVDIYNNLYNN